MRRLLLLPIIAAIVLAASGTTWSSPADAVPHSFQQPDGSEIIIIGFGDEFYNYHETPDGYTAVRADDGWWHYAALSEEARFEPSGYRVGLDSPGAMSVGKHLRELPAVVSEHRQQSGYLEFKAGLAPAAPPANKDVPVLLIEFPDHAATETVQSFDDMMNMPNYDGTGSFKEYYMEISYGAHNVTGYVTGWYTAAENRNYYRHDGADHSERSNELVRNAVDQAEAAGVDFSAFDTDGDGRCDGVFVVHQGPGAEEGGNTQYIWSHRSRLSNFGLEVTYDNVLIDDYIMMPELQGGSHCDIGVFAHEYGHNLGLPDLYDTDDSNGESAGIGHWGIMGSGSWNTTASPAHMCCFHKTLLGWLTPTVVSGWSPSMVIPQIETTPFALKVWTNGAPGSEYFMISNRQPVGFDLHLHGCGLVIWHIDESVSGNQDENHKRVDVEEADGLTQMDDNVNRGDNGDPWPGVTNNRNFLYNTNPNSRSYSGANTHVEVRDISDCGAFMMADVDVAPYPASAPIWGVMSRAGDAMVGKTVRLLNSSYGFVMSTVTDLSGQYFFPVVSNGDYFIEPVLSPGWVSLNGKQIPLTVHGHAEVVNIPVAQIRFDNFQPPHLATVDDYLPLVSAHISVLGGTPTVFEPASIEMVFNGSAVDHSYDPGSQVASYQVTDTLPNGSYTAHLDVDDMYGDPGPHASWTFEVLVPYGNVQGYVTCGGAGVGDVNVHLYNAGGWVATTTTAPDGFYRYDHMNVGNGDYHVRIQVPDCYGPASDTIVDVTVFGWPDAEADFELLRIYASDLAPAPGTTVDTCQTTISAQLNVLGGTLADVDPASIVMMLNGGVVPHSYNLATGLISYFTDPPLPNDDYTVTIDVDDMLGYSACRTDWQFDVLQPYGDVAGTVTDNGNGGAGLLGVPIALVNPAGDTLAKTVTEADGSFFFGHIDNGGYIVAIWQMPLGYLPEFSASLPVTVFGWPSAEAHFPLNRDASPPGCDGRSNFFWAWEVWGAIQNYQGLRYTRDDIICFREKVHAHFDPWIPHFVEVETLRDMFCTLFRFWNSTCRQEAMSHYYALLLNLASGRINTYDLVSEDGVTAAQAVLYISQLLETGDPDDTKLALGLARAVNWEWCILPPGWIPLTTPNIAFKDGGEVSALPTEFELSQNYPNPFNPTTDIRLALPRSCEIRLDVFNVLGQRVTTLVDGALPAGYHTITWDATGSATGVYFYRVVTDEFVTSRKMVLVK